ncbi:lytic transglycosylase domain-containing protein [Anaeromyxobacter sp. K]|uniref:lytic transglycosylase domain-containing protein n=1 Tax=Anaeromyxobacter sp. (strain K) TaxID=447217 RepID=UPI0002EC0247|nr:lytic transglycosylase domain-containing protein [Anaeromyxobacter sp. K]
MRGWLAARRWAELPVAAWALLAVALLLAVNLAVQVVRKPTELLGAVVPTSPKAPAETWAEYGPLFEAHATDLVRPEVLAALVQLESAGDPLARTYWRWRWTTDPLRVWAPASSAVGILQITDGTYAQARRLCIHDHRVARDGAWWDPDACWFNALYLRTVPSHAVEMTAAWLHVCAADALAGSGTAGPADARRLAAVIHLCGRERGAAFARRGFAAAPGERCGDHELGAYLARVDGLAAAFARMGAQGGRR